LIVSRAISKLFSFVGDRIVGSVSGLAGIMACSTAVLSFICNFLELLGNYGYICFGNLSACVVFFLFFDSLFVELVVQCEWALNIGMGFIVGDHLFLPVVKLAVVFNNVFRLVQDAVLVILDHFVFFGFTVVILVSALHILIDSSTTSSFSVSMASFPAFLLVLGAVVARVVRFFVFCWQVW
jgi:hypothetical protein